MFSTTEMNQVQGSDAWLENRRKSIGASEIATALGKGGFGNTRHKLYLEKLGLAPDKEQNFAMAKGSAHEDVSLAIFERLTGIKVFPVCKTDDRYPYLSASFDGMTLDQSEFVELKNGAYTYRMACDGIIPEYYQYQVQQQILISGLEKAHYLSVSYQGDFEAAVKSAIHIIVPRDEEMINEIINEGKLFWDMVESRSPPPLTDKDFVDKEGNSLWGVISRKLKEIDAEIKKYEVITKGLVLIRDGYKQALIDDAGQNSCMGYGIRLNRSLVQGRVNYSKIPKLEDVNLDDYRTESKERWTLTIKKD